MAKIPQSEKSVSALIDAAIENSEGPNNRFHLGISQLGHACDRYLWLSFRWAVIEKFNGRMLRLFRRGQNEEATVVSDLRRIGCDVRNTGTAQSRVSFGSHVSGSIDGIIESGVPESPKTRHILEIKTHSKKSFEQLKKDGVEKAKPLHFAQMQGYMLGTDTERALYFAVCKDNDEIYTERIKHNKDASQAIITRGQRIALSERMPEPLSTREDWYECKYCAGHDMCFGSKLTKEVNCRTCAHSTPTEDSKWLCARYDNASIPGEAQRNGCECHVLHPDLVPYKRFDGTEWTAVYEIDGHKVENGEPCANVYSSKEIVANAHGCANADGFVRELRGDGARIVELTEEDIHF